MVRPCPSWSMRFASPWRGGENIVWAIFVARERSRFEGELIKARAEAQGLARRLAAWDEARRALRARTAKPGEPRPAPPPGGGPEPGVSV